MTDLDRRLFLGAAVGASLGLPRTEARPIARSSAPFGLSLAAYSFRDHLTGKLEPRWSFVEFIDYAASLGFGGVELTEYYFPESVSEEYLLGLKNRAHRAGLVVTSLPIRSRFTHAQGEERERELAHARLWLDRAALLGAPTVRVFAGDLLKGQTQAEAEACCIETLVELTRHAARIGVFVAVENHGGVVAECAALLRLVRAVDSPWCGINLDSGNFHTDDPYGDFARAADHAVMVQFKPHVTPRGGRRGKPDWRRLVDILGASRYRGFVALEYEDRAPPLEGVPWMLGEVRAALAETR